MTICNPVNLSYRFQLEGIAEESCREAADPSVVRYGDRIWMFASKSGGYWHTTDLVDWQFVPTSVLPTEDYAPDAEIVDGQIVVTSSRNDRDCPMFRTTDPAADRWEHVSDCPKHWDPGLFQDTDGQVYRYWGCSNRVPIRCDRLDRETLTPVCEPFDVYIADTGVHGWERCGEDHAEPGRPPFTEGPWMTKHNGTYYLQYAVPGTEWNVYNDAVLRSDSPTGPFTPQAHNPLSYKPGGFITGAGHGSTFQDLHGNWWHASTMRISVKHDFERRVGIFPAGFDADGVLFCNTSFGDYPTRTPTGPWDPWADPFAGWMLLSYRAAATASSALPGHGPELACTEDVRTYWAAEGEADEWLCVDLGEVSTIHAVQTNFAEHNVRRYGRDGDGLYIQYGVEASTDGETWTILIDRVDAREDRPHDYVELDNPVEARYLRLIVRHTPGGSVAVSGLRAFGRGAGQAPLSVESITAERSADDATKMTVRWTASPGADGTNVRWGVAPDKLYCSCLVYEADRLEIGALAIGQTYHVAVEPFNRNGVGPLSAPLGPV